MASEHAREPAVKLVSIGWASEPPQRELLPGGNPRASALASSAVAADRQPNVDVPTAAPGKRDVFAGPLWRQLPSWLSSTTLHLLILILLGLLFVDAPGGSNRLTLNVSLGPAGSGESEGDDDAAGALVAIDVDEPLEAASEPPAEALTDPFEELADATGDVQPPLVTAPFASSRPGSDITTGGMAASVAVGAGLDDGDRGGAGLAAARTQVFGLAEEAASFVYVFDRSQSMNSTLSFSTEDKLLFSITPLDAAKAELLRSLGDLGRNQKFQIIFYNHDTEFLSAPTRGQRLLVASDSVKRRAADFVKAMPGEGGTYHLEPLELALRMRPDVVFLLTDGEAKDDPSDVDLDRVRGLNRGRSRINVIHFCLVPRPATALVKLAQENDGQYLALNISQLAAGVAKSQQPSRDGSPADASP